MRLEILSNGHRLKNRIALKVMRIFAGVEPDDVIKTSMYRPLFFGQPWLRFVKSMMRGRSELLLGERELIAAFVSNLNSCPYCLNVHTEVAKLTLYPQFIITQIENWRNTDFNPHIKAIFELLEKLHHSSEKIDSQDMKKVLSTGISVRVLEDALYTAFLFNTINRLANAFGYDHGTENKAAKIASILNRTRYNVPGFLLN